MGFVQVLAVWQDPEKMKPGFAGHALYPCG
jgi:hypothetical protein